jgi:anaerobic selenocysteine-containing dehydrogenase
MVLAKALQNQGMQVTVLEKTGKFARFGGPIQLASNALATIKGIIKHVIERDDAARSRGEPAIIDHAFIAQHTGGYDAFAADVRTESWATIEAESGLPEHEIRQAGDTYIKAGSVIACWGMGITQHESSVATIRMITNLLLMRGNLGRPGAGVWVGAAPGNSNLFLNPGRERFTLDMKFDF